MDENEQDIPVTDESEVDEPTEETVDPDFDRALRDGVGFHDANATEMDTESPDLDTEDEPTVEEPEEEVT